MASSRMSVLAEDRGAVDGNMVLPIRSPPPATDSTAAIRSGILTTTMSFSLVSLTSRSNSFQAGAGRFGFLRPSHSSGQSY